MKTVKCIYIKDAEVDNMKKIIPNNLKAILGTMSIHQVISKSQDAGVITHRKLSCFCGTEKGCCDCFAPQTYRFNTTTCTLRNKIELGEINTIFDEDAVNSIPEIDCLYLTQYVENINFDEITKLDDNPNLFEVNLPIIAIDKEIENNIYPSDNKCVYSLEKNSEAIQTPIKRVLAESNDNEPKKLYTIKTETNKKIVTNTVLEKNIQIKPSKSLKTPISRTIQCGACKENVSNYSSDFCSEPVALPVRQHKVILKPGETLESIALKSGTTEDVTSQVQSETPLHEALKMTTPTYFDTPVPVDTSTPEQATLNPATIVVLESPKSQDHLYSFELGNEFDFFKDKDTSSNEENSKSQLHSLLSKHTKGKLLIENAQKGESKELYYVPYHVVDGKVIQASGLIHNRLITHRRSLAAVGTKKRNSDSDSGCSSKSSTASKLHKRIRPLPDEFKESEHINCQQNLDWLQGTSYPQETLKHRWQSTFDARIKILKEVSFIEYFKRFPGLSLPNGHKLLTSDFQTVYPLANHKFEENFPLIKLKLLKLLADKAESNRSDDTIIELLDLASDK
ncbi:hypothetical protein ACJJTC_005247 [Scirpophaga incertulas]